MINLCICDIQFNSKFVQLFFNISRNYVHYNRILTDTDFQLIPVPLSSVYNHFKANNKYIKYLFDMDYIRSEEVSTNFQFI